jgi:hypothetical protein
MRCAFATVRSTDLGKLKSTMPSTTEDDAHDPQTKLRG